MGTIILIADDAHKYAEYLHDCFIGSGVSQVLTATEPLRVLDLVQKYRPMVLISEYDFGPRVVDGLSLCNRARRLYPNVQCILITRHTLPATSLRFHGVLFHLRKPFTFSTLHSVVAAAIRERVQPKSGKLLEFARNSKETEPQPR
jgi:CheY-like chemotaxis protein